MLRCVGGAFGVEVVFRPVFRDEVGPHDDLLGFGHPFHHIFAGVEFHSLSVNLDDERNRKQSGVVESGGEARFAVISVAEQAGERIFEDVQPNFGEGEREIVGPSVYPVVNFEIVDGTFREFGSRIGGFCPSHDKFVVAEQLLYVAHEFAIAAVVVSEGEIGLKVDRHAAFEEIREGIFQVDVLRHRAFVSQLAARSLHLFFPLATHAFESVQLRTSFSSALGIDIVLEGFDVAIEVFDEEIDLLQLFGIEEGHGIFEAPVAEPLHFSCIGSNLAVVHAGKHAGHGRGAADQMAAVVDELDERLRIGVFGELKLVAPEIFIVEEHASEGRCDVIEPPVSIERDGAREAHAVGIECHHGEQAAPLPVQHFIELLQSRRVDVGIGGVEGLEGKLEEACARPGGGHTGNEGGELVAAHFIEDFTGFDALNVGGRHVEFVPFARRTGRQIGVTLDEQCFCRHSFVGD